ncbi:unnamed protein product [Leptidea sinapis]|uniref:Xylose isomerase n=1 Tax=Leptidea sinapis TaxID=189913 RepID=A0A5E4QDS7_9NEOP|nr:unnamed protein product [Leptidea sinapis]
MPAAFAEFIDDIEDLVSSQDITPKERYASRKSVSVRSKKREIKEYESAEKVILESTQTIYVKTWGCAHNNSDSEYMAGLLAAHGYKLTEDKWQAQLWLLNSCTVKNPSEDHFNGGGVRASGGTSLFLPTGSQCSGGHTVRLFGSKKTGEGRKAGGASLLLPKVRKNPLIEIISINTGCLNQCTYCKTKHARGELGSYPPDEISRGHHDRHGHNLRVPHGDGGRLRSDHVSVSPPPVPLALHQPIGQIQEVLVTDVSHDKNYFVAHNEFYEQVLVPKEERYMGKMLTVRICSASKFSMVGEVIDKPKMAGLVRPLRKGEVSGVKSERGIEKIEYNNAATATDTLCYRYYNPVERVHSKTMEEWLKYSASLTDFRRSAFFDLCIKLGIKYWTAYDTDLVPLTDSWDENKTNWDEIMEYIVEMGQRYHLKLLWVAPDLHSNPRYYSGAITNNDANVFAQAATQIKKCLEVSHRLAAECFLIWPHREGYGALFQSDVAREIKLFVKLLKITAEFKDRLNTKIQLLLMPYHNGGNGNTLHEHEMIHYYMWDVTSCLFFLKNYGLDRHYKVCSPPGHDMYMTNIKNQAHVESPNAKCEHYNFVFQRYLDTCDHI